MSGDQRPSTYDGFPDLLGQTPLIRLRRLLPNGPRVWAKWEGANATGSAKDRPAAKMLSRALEDGSLRKGDTVVESSSGNLGVALAALCRWHGLEFVCVIDPRTNPSTARMIQAYGGRVARVEQPDPATGDWLVARQAKVAELLTNVPGAWSPNQYANADNARAHHEGTMAEVVDLLGPNLRAMYVAVSTTGTLGGCRSQLDDLGMDTDLVAVDAEGSVLFGGQRGDRVLPGFGAGNVPALAQQARPTRVVRIDPLTAVAGAKALVGQEVLLAGASSGAVVAAFLREADRYDPDDDVVLMLHDHGSKYLESIYDDGWVERELGETPGQLAERVTALLGHQG